MNYDQARQTKDGGWHWTTMNDGVVRTAAPCIRFLKPFDYSKPFEPAKPEDIERCTPHATQEEAERHFYDYCFEAENIHENTTANWMDCAKCGAPTKRLLGNRSMSQTIQQEALCDEHFSIETLRELHPFRREMTLMHS